MWKVKLDEYQKIPINKYKNNLLKQSIDVTIIKSINGSDSIGPNPTDRGRNGNKISILVDHIGVPISRIITEANKSDHKLTDKTLQKSKLKRKSKSFLYADKDYSNKYTKQVADEHNFILNAPNKKNFKKPLFKEPKDGNYCRYVIEALNSWIKNFKRLRNRYERYINSYDGFLLFAFSFIINKKIKNRKI